MNFGSLSSPASFANAVQITEGSVTGTSPVNSFSFGVDEQAANEMASVFDAGFGPRAGFAATMFFNPAETLVKWGVNFVGGVTYRSGSGDYAEWMERLDPSERLLVGDIVGAHGGKISRKTGNADHVLVVSFKPIVLGNLPPDGEQHLYEKIAFMGQTIVKVRGIVRPGDFIIPSGLGDGTGIAVHPDAIKAEQLGQVVGVAWDHGGRFGGIGLVNIAVGLRPVEVAKVVGAQQTELDLLRQEQARFGAKVATLLRENENARAQVRRLETEMAALQGELDVKLAALSSILQTRRSGQDG